MCRISDKDSKGKRINYLDALKCLGIILVVEGHVMGTTMGVRVYDSLSRLMFYSFNMPIFFFVSGYLACRGYGNSAKEVWHKLFKKAGLLVLPAVIFSICSALVSHHDLFSFLQNGFGKYWFTITLWECFLFYYLICMLFQGKRRIIILLLLSLIDIGMLITHVDRSFPAILDINHLVKYFQYFVFGVIAMTYREKFETLFRNETFKAFITIAFWGLLLSIDSPGWPSTLFHFSRDLMLRYFGTAMILSFFVCHAKVFDRDRRCVRIVLAVGKHSLAIYMLQYFFIPSSWLLSISPAGIDMFSAHIIAFVYSVVIVIVCFVFIAILGNSNFIRKYALGK